MKYIFLTVAIAIAAAMTACEINSDPTKDKKVNFKNTEHVLPKDERIFENISKCRKSIDFKIDRTYAIEPGNDNDLSADQAARNLSTQPLTLWPVENAVDIKTNLTIKDTVLTSDELELRKVSDGQYDFEYKGDYEDLFAQGKNYAKFKVELDFNITDNFNNRITACQQDQVIDLYIMKPSSTEEEQ